VALRERPWRGRLRERRRRHQHQHDEPLHMSTLAPRERDSSCVFSAQPRSDTRCARSRSAR
jgi:hypothetical protein